MVKCAHIAKDVYSGQYVGAAPDIIVGYDWGYRTSWESALGDVMAELIAVSKEKWSGDHCGATGVVPGVLFASSKIALAQPHLYDLAPTILAEFGIEKPKDMVGNDVFQAPPGSSDNIKALPYM